MSLFWLTMFVLGLSVSGYFVGRHRALSSSDDGSRGLHSLPVYYGTNVLMSVLVPSFAFIIVMMLIGPFYIERSVSGSIPDSAVTEGTSRSLMMADVRRVADGLDQEVSTGQMTEAEVADLRADTTDIRARLGEIGFALGSDVTAPVLTAAQTYRAMNGTLQRIVTVGTILLALAGFAYSAKRTNKDFRARNTVEKLTLALLLGAACVAILTTIGIVLSLVFNTIEFFRLYPALDFFLGTTWAPSFSGRGGQSDLGVIPLIWGTLYISLIALAVAVPIGLFAAIYLSEYASPRLRSFVKPALEVLAGIPTIVYGLFALTVVGPMLLGVFGSGGVGWMQGASSVLTAGLVMGIMLIPFVSSLSDDIINAVPQAMRDGSLGLGATPSETVRQVVMPAALPGIVGAILLAASRAIGETMIVVMGAGAAARLSMNPFEAMTTVTAKIVSQLTGDSEFTSPETLVAFALGMTLFVITLGMNVLALSIVRKYREQYE